MKLLPMIHGRHRSRTTWTVCQRVVQLKVIGSAKVHCMGKGELLASRRVREGGRRRWAISEGGS